MNNIKIRKITDPYGFLYKEKGGADLPKASAGPIQISGQGMPAAEKDIFLENNAPGKYSERIKAKC